MASILRHNRTRALFAVLLALVLATGCSQSEQLQPKQSNVWLVSESRESAIGQEVAVEVEKEYPVYQGPELTAYVNEIGQKLAAVSDRTSVTYTFKVLDTPIVNAFAAPGGYVYVTRGLLGVLDDEAELAGVIAHEVGHVAARHSAKQIQNTTIASTLITAAAVLAGQKVSDEMLQAVDVAGGLIVLGYSRGDEYQADLLGAKYLYRSGYDPRGMIDSLNGLMELETRDPMKVEEFFQSHPFTKERVKHLEEWLPRIEREDVWGGEPPHTNYRGKEAYQKFAVPVAIYPGSDEMRTLIENYRLSWTRGDLELLDKVLADQYQDDLGRDKKAYIAYMSKIIESARSITFKVTNVQTEPRRQGGAAKYDYVIQIKDKNSGSVREERGRTYLEFVKPEPNVWKISSIRVMPS